MRPRLTQSAGRRVARSFMWTAAALFSLAALVGCDTETPGPTTQPQPPAPFIDLQLGSFGLGLFQGENDSVVISVSRSGSFADEVTLAITGAPPGVTATFEPPSIAPGASGSVLRLTTKTTTPPGTYSLTITANGSGVPGESARLNLTVMPAPAAAITVWFDGDFVFTVQGDSWTWPGVTVIRGAGYTGPVDLSIEGLPDGVTARFNPASLDAGTKKSEITFTAGTGAATGNFYPTIRARGAGVSDATTVFWLMVAPPWR